MGELVRWFFDHAAQLIESGGIMVGLFFTGFALRADVRSRQAEILMRLTENHRALWMYHDGHPELGRIFQREVDLSVAPVTAAETRFVQYFINHVILSFRTQKLGLYQSPEQMEMDLKEFFSYPVPLAAWIKVKRYQDRDFEEFMERVIKRGLL